MDDVAIGPQMAGIVSEGWGISGTVAGYWETGTQAFYRKPKNVCLESSVVMSVIVASATERNLRVVSA
jgi:hypothetical protein